MAITLIATCAVLAPVLAMRGGLFRATVPSSRSADRAGFDIASAGVFLASDKHYSNIYPEDYVGPEACGRCHPENYQLWRSHPHSRMNRDATQETVLGDFSGQALVYGGHRVVFDRQDGEYAMTVYRENRIFRRFKVTRTVGSRFVQFYMGLQTDGPEPPDHASYRVESKLFFAYSLRLEKWLPAIYFGSAVFPEEGDGFSYADFIFNHPRLQTWEENCLSCHNTYPYLFRLGTPGLTGFPAELIQFRGVGTANASPGGSDKPLPPHSQALVTLGVSCESCHFGGREHALEEKEIRFVPTSPDLVLRKPSTSPAGLTDRKNPFVVNSICTQCHNSHPDRYPNGAAMRNSSEALDIAAGACAGAVKCTDCHNPHRPGPRYEMPDETRFVDACLSCHEKYRTPDVLAGHTRHPPSARITCLDCHMPRIVQGIETAVRTHCISSPTDPRILRAGAPNACNLCHPDRSLAWTLNALEEGWGRTIVAAPGWSRAYGDSLELPVGEVWLHHRRQPVRFVAANAYADSGLGLEALPPVLTILNDPFAVNRMTGVIAVGKILGRRLENAEYDLLAPPARRVSQLRLLADRLQAARAWK